MTLPARLTRLEARLRPPTRNVIWMQEGDQVRNPRTGEVLAQEVFRARYPTARTFTFRFGRALDDADG